MNRLPTILDGVIACGLALTALLAISSGFSINLGLFALRLHDWMRPLAATTLLIGIRLWVASRARPYRRAATDESAWRVATVVLAAVTLTSIGYWLVFLTTICGGSDSYGYVAASELIRSGRLIEPQPIAAWLPVPNPLDLSTPAGFVPAADRTGIAPSYPLGFPVLMAAAQMVFGPTGPYLVPPFCAAILLLIAWRLAVTWYGERAGWLASALVAWEAIVVTYAKQPMSDVSATMFALTSVWCLARSRRLPLVAGLAAGASFVVRPGGIGLMAALAAFAVWPRERRWGSATWFALGLAPFVLAQAFLQWRLFGSPFTSGYGPVAQLFAGGSVWTNLQIYLHGLWSIHSAIWFLGLLAACFVRPRTPLLLAAAALVLSGIPYVLYFEFDHWETLRFLLPAIVLATIAAAGGLSVLAARLGSSWFATAAIVACALATAVQTERFLAREGVPALTAAELRYPLVAAHLKERTAPNAIVLAAQHSGSIRHYGDRLTLRWDLMRSEDLEPVLSALAERGHPVYLVLEGTEQRRFTTGFADPLRRVHMYPFGQIRNIQIWELVR